MLISPEMVAQFDGALERLRISDGLVLDLYDIPRASNTAVAEPILILRSGISYPAVMKLLCHTPHPK